MHIRFVKNVSLAYTFIGLLLSFIYYEIFFFSFYRTKSRPRFTTHSLEKENTGGKSQIISPKKELVVQVAQPIPYILKPIFIDSDDESFQEKGVSDIDSFHAECNPECKAVVDNKVDGPVDEQQDSEKYKE